MDVCTTPRCHRRLGPLLLGAALDCAAFALPQAVRLNEPLPHVFVNGEVRDYAVSRDGAWVVFRADSRADGVEELFRVPSDHGAPPSLLSQPLGGDRQVFAFALGDGRAVYTSDAITNDHVELFSAPLDGSAGPVRLSQDFTNGAVSNIWIDPAGTTVLFTIWDAFFVERLCRVPIDGSQPAVVIGNSGVGYTPFAGTGITELRFSGDGQRVAFVAQTYDDDYQPTRLFAVPVDGSHAQVPLSDANTFERVLAYEISADGSRVAWVFGPAGASGRLYAAAADGSALTQLVPANVTPRIALTPDGDRVAFSQGHVYSVRSDGTQLLQLDPVPTSGLALRLAPDGHTLVFLANSHLYAVPIDGSASATDLFGPNATADFEISADSSRLAGVVDNATFRALEVVPLTGGPAVLLNGPSLPGRGVAPTGQMLVLGDGRVTFREDRGTNDVFELRSAPLDGSQAAVLVSDALGGGRDVQSFALLAGGRAAYLADAEVDEVFELFGAPLDGSAAPLRYHPTYRAPRTVGDVLAFQPAGERVVYRADQDADEAFELFSVLRDGHGGARRLNPPLQNPNNDVEPDFTVSATGEHVAFQVHHVGAPYTLHVARADGSASAALVDQTIFGTGFSFPVRFSPDETHLAYRKDLGASDHLGLFTWPLDASQPPVQLDLGAIAAGTVFDDWRFTPGGERVVFRADREVDGKIELYAVPSDGSAPPVKLSLLLVAGRRVTDFELTPDGSRVVYRADPRIRGCIELFSAPVTGGASVRLNPPLGSTRDVSEYAIAADGQRVVYRADQVVDQQQELYSVPITGPVPAHASSGGPISGGLVKSVVRLTPLASGQDAGAAFRIRLDGSEVFFTLASFPNPTDLYRVPIDGSAAPVRVNGPQLNGGAVAEFELSADGAFLVYRADERANDHFELFSVPLAGGPVVALGTLPTLPAFAYVYVFQIAPDSANVIYLANHEREPFELFSAPLDGSAPPTRLNSPLAPGGNVASDFAALPGGRALFRADQATDEVVELFLGFVQHRTRPAGPP